MSADLTSVPVTAGQAQRIACLRWAFELTASRGVAWTGVWAIARWLYDGREASS